MSVPVSARLTICLGAVAIVLSACGGGGDSGPAASTSDFPVASAISAYAQGNHQFNLAGSLSGTNFTMSYSYVPGAASTFEGKPFANTALETLILKANGALASQTTSKAYFAVNPFVSYGSVDQNDGTYSVFNWQTNLRPPQKSGNRVRSGMKPNTPTAARRRS